MIQGERILNGALKLVIKTDLLLSPRDHEMPRFAIRSQSVKLQPLILLSALLHHGLSLLSLLNSEFYDQVV